MRDAMSERTRAPNSKERSVVRQIQPLDIRNPATGRWMTDHQQQEWHFVLRPAQHLVEKPHGAGCMCQRRQSGAMQRGDEQTGRDADRFVRVVALVPVTVGIDA